MNKPNQETIRAYLRAIHDQYYPLLMADIGKVDDKVILEQPKENQLNSEQTNNIIDFTKYLKIKQQLGNI